MADETANLLSDPGMRLDPAERRLPAGMPLHAITSVHGEAGLQERLATEIAGFPAADRDRARDALAPVVSHPGRVGMTDSQPDVFAAVDVHYLCSGGARAAAVTAGDPAFSAIQAEWTVPVPAVLPYQPGQFFLRELPPLRRARTRAQP